MLDLGSAGNCAASSRNPLSLPLPMTLRTCQVLGGGSFLGLLGVQGFRGSRVFRVYGLLLAYLGLGFRVLGFRGLGRGLIGFLGAAHAACETMARVVDS